jgi:hypothetical protein
MTADIPTCQELIMPCFDVVLVGHACFAIAMFKEVGSKLSLDENNAFVSSVPHHTMGFLLRRENHAAWWPKNVAENTSFIKKTVESFGGEKIKDGLNRLCVLHVSI